MYDELIKRLRETPSIPVDTKLHNEAADAIEELQRSKCPHYIRNVHDRGGDSLCDKWMCEVKSLPKWIPVTERLPLLNTPVLATDGIEVDISWMYGVPPRWITSYTAIDEGKLTHWMPLPKTPQPLEEDIPIEYFESGSK